MIDKKIKVVELFAGVGGFRIGLEGWKGRSALSRYTKKMTSNYEVIWGNQFEPASTKQKQDAFRVYQTRFEGEHSNEDIQEIVQNNISKIPDHDLLVGGFPCQDYSVARTLRQAEGIEGRKGVLWWSIYNILHQKIQKKKPVKYLMLENVDRLLKSPANQRGRDFAIMLTSLSELGYAVEWRVINAAEYGMPQRRKRVFFIGYHRSTNIYKDLLKRSDKVTWLKNESIIETAFPTTSEIASVMNEKLLDDKTLKLSKNINDHLVYVTENFNKAGGKSKFNNTGLMINLEYWTFDSKPIVEKERTLGEIIITDEKAIPEEYFLDNDAIYAWKALKGAKKLSRTSKDGHIYEYSEGSMSFPDSLDKPSRTIITGEGGASPSRFKHVIITPGGRYRRLTPIELERLNMFPDNHTELDKISDIKRSFFMGNALVVGIVERLGRSLSARI